MSEYIGAHKAHTESVLLLFWGNDCSPNKKAAAKKPLSWHWSEKPPTIREMQIDCIGSLKFPKHENEEEQDGRKKRPTFTIDGILPQALMPSLSDGEKKMFMKALTTKVAKQTGWRINGGGLKGILELDIVDWQGTDTTF
tara:strand:- start:270 stop:689 length:420 start_codon:yes stop_codon:yes gene_type:complete